MCSRYFLELKALMELEDKIDYPFELALKDKIDYYPSNNIFIIENKNDKLIGSKARWGYKIFDNKLVINARQETIQEKSLFKKDIINHRCIIPANGFYEWDIHKHKFTFENENGQLMMMAGVYRIVNGQKEVAIITTDANESMEGIHQRMPLIFNYQQKNIWLKSNDYKHLLKVKPLPLKIISGSLQTSLF